MHFLLLGAHAQLVVNFCVLLKKRNIYESTLKNTLNTNWQQRHRRDILELTLRRTLNVTLAVVSHQETIQAGTLVQTFRTEQGI